MDDEDGRNLAGLLDVLGQTQEWAARTSVGAERLRPDPRSPLSGDDSKTDPYHLSHTVWRHLSNAADHLSCLRALLGDAKVIHMYAPFTLVRGGLENACAATWLLQPPARRERVTRRFRMAVSDIRHENQAGRLMGQATPADAEKRIEEVCDIAELAGADRAAVKRNVTYAEIVKAVDEGVPGSLVLLSWKTCSGFAHGDWWTTKSASRRTQVPGGGEGVGTFAIRANLSLLMKMTAIAVAETNRGWQLHDARCRSPYG